MEAACIQPGSDVFERILDADKPLVVLETDAVAALIDQFRHLARRSGQAVYLWRPQAGLRSLREAEVPVPGCQHLADTLRYVLQSMHFGVYLFAGVEFPLAASDRALLRKVSRSTSGPLRRVVMLLEDSPDASLAGMGTLLNGRDVLAARPRLRDGRWVV